MKDISKLLIKYSIYPTKTESCGAIEGYLSSYYPEFFSKFTEDTWIGFYNENIYKLVNFLSDNKNFWIN